MLNCAIKILQVASYIPHRAFTAHKRRGGKGTADRKEKKIEKDKFFGVNLLAKACGV